MGVKGKTDCGDFSSQSELYSFWGWGRVGGTLRKVSQQEREGEVEFPKMLKSLGQEEDVAVYVNTLLPTPYAWGDGRKGPQAQKWGR